MDVPPTDNSAVDGYAVASADIPATGTRAFDVAAELAAGAVFSGTLRSGQTLRIMTGAPMPAGADTVYPQEVVAREGARITVGSIAPGANRRLRGEDVRAGQIVLPAGSVLRPQEIGVAASLGLAQIYVRQKPRVAVLSTGDEVAEPGSSRKPGQIYDSNRFSLCGLLEASGAEMVDDGIVPDQFDELQARLLRASEHADIVLTSGGVSVGDHDLVKAVLQQAGGIDFWQVAMQPGRPMAVGSIGLLRDNGRFAWPSVFDEKFFDPKLKKDVEVQAQELFQQSLNAKVDKNALKDLKANDAHWREGRTFLFGCSAGCRSPWPGAGCSAGSAAAKARYSCQQCYFRFSGALLWRC